MGPLILPPDGPIYVDANAIIYSVERSEPYCTLLDPLWRQVEIGQHTTVSSVLAVMEALVKPIRDGNVALEMLFRSVFNTGDITLMPATRELWEDSARMRAATGLRTPDALHAATALRAGCTLFISNDRDFRRVPSLPIVVLDEVAKA